MTPINDMEYIQAARDNYGSGGEIEIEEGAVVSRSTEPGAYVAAWVWVPNHWIEED